MRKVAINGLGRIGRAAFKVILNNPELDLVAINDIASSENLVYLLKYDSVYGRYDRTIEFNETGWLINGKSIKIFKEKDPSMIPWRDMDVDIVFECTGRFTKRADAEKHLTAGAKHVILSAPAKSDDVPTVVNGVNEANAYDRIISCASCTTNCITPVLEIIKRNIGIQKAIMSTTHAYTSSQQIVDSPSSKKRRGRAAAMNFVPASTGAAKATIKILTEFKDKFDGIAIRGPVPVGSISDITIITERATTVEEINRIFIHESESKRYKGIVGVTDEEIVSSDIIMDSRASIIDLTLTRVVDENLVKIMSWYDNEWGYANQMVKTGIKLLEKREHPSVIGEG